MHEWFCSPPCSDAHKKRQIPQCAGGAKRLSPCLLLRRRHAALKAPPSRRAEGATNARRLGRHTVPRLGCHRYAVLKAPLPRRSSPLPRLLAQAFGGHQRRAPRRHVRRTNGKERLLRSMYNIVATTDRRASKRAVLKLVGLWCSRIIISLHGIEAHFASFLDLLLWQ